ncbi:MAG: agmatine deiminase family protein [Candidatus Peregrinibacteria bacterium]|nr:agmatine deiminase family protein [Candidatus Peregrinibacteria bacterium]
MNAPCSSTPSLTERGYRMPAEWEPHEATWLAYPFDPGSRRDAHRHWPNGVFKRRGIEEQWADMARSLAPSEAVNIIVRNIEAWGRLHKVFNQVSAGLAEHRNVRTHFVANNWSWIRDTGGIFLVNDQTGERCITDWAFNGWGKEPWKSECDLDNQVPFQMAKIAGVERHTIAQVLEGGSIDVNGTGSLLTTEECLLNENRLLPGEQRRTKEDVERTLCENLGVENVLWLERGIGGDDTSGHIDDLTRFVSRDTVITMVAPRSSGEDHRVLKRNLQRLEAMRNERGRQLSVIEVPLPKPDSLWGLQLPMSYANFYIGNDVVLAPVFNDPNDAKALGALQQAFPDRRIIDLYAKDLVWGLGTYHCSTQQEPAPLHPVAEK